MLFTENTKRQKTTENIFSNIFSKPAAIPVGKPYVQVKAETLLTE